MIAFRGGSSVVRAQPSRAEIAGSAPAPRSIPNARSIVVALAAGLALDAASHARGFNAGFAGLSFRPDQGDDWLAYAAGHRDGAIERTLQQRARAA